MITYLSQLTLCWGIFYVVYHFWLRQETHFKYNRLYLLLSLGLGVVLPLADWSLLISHQPESLGHLYIAPFNTQMAEWDYAVEASPQYIDWSQVMWTVYLMGFLVAITQLIRGWFTILSIRRKSEMYDQHDYTLVLTAHSHMPFSFLNSVYCSHDFYTNFPDIEKILVHETFHIKARHSLDIIALELLKVVFWFHPLVYFYKRELQQIHEYQADYAAYHLSNRKAYGKLLLSQIESGIPVALANHFFNSQLKNRFKMMTKKPSTRQSLFKYLLIIPAMTVTVLLFSFTGQGKSLIQAEIVQQDTILPIPPPPPPLPPPPPPIPPLPGIGEVMSMGSDEYQVKKTDLLYVNGQRIGYLTQELIDKYSADGPWVFEVFTKKAAQERIDPGIETNVYSIRKKIPTLDEVNKKYNPDDKKGSEIFRVVEEMPRFPGCEDMEGNAREIKSCADRKMLQFLYSHIKYPATARQNGVEGNVVISFVVEKDGSITDPKVIRDPGAGLGEESVRVVHMMGDLPEKWIPGRQRGEAVRVQFILPVKFQLTTPKKEATEAIVTEESLRIDTPESANQKTGVPRQEAPMSGALLVIDGEIMGTVNSSELIKSVDPQDIESISVLKGESAKEKYGQKGANGVVEIYTKWRNKTKSPRLEMTNVRIYPVPAENSLNIEAATPGAGDYKLDIRDLKGSVVRSQTVSVNDGVMRTHIDLSGLSAGPYFLLISRNGKLFSKSFVKQ